MKILLPQLPKYWYYWHDPWQNQDEEPNFFEAWEEVEIFTFVTYRSQSVDSFCLFIFVFWSRVSLCNLDCPGTCSVAQAISDLEILLPLPPGY